jgi:hypothetical protein
MASPAFDTSAFDTSAFDVAAFDLGAGEIGPTPDVGTGFSRRRTAAFVRKNADFVNRSA